MQKKRLVHFDKLNKFFVGYYPTRRELGRFNGSGSQNSFEKRVVDHFIHLGSYPIVEDTKTDIIFDKNIGKEE